MQKSVFQSDLFSPPVQEEGKTANCLLIEKLEQDKTKLYQEIDQKCKNTSKTSRKANEGSMRFSMSLYKKIDTKEAVIKFIKRDFRIDVETAQDFLSENFNWLTPVEKSRLAPCSVYEMTLPERRILLMKLNEKLNSNYQKELKTLGISKTKNITIKVPVSSNRLEYAANGWGDLSLLTEDLFLKTWQCINAARYMLSYGLELSNAKNGNRHVISEAGKIELVQRVNDEFIRRKLNLKYTLFIERRTK
jgi:hypothetical protein